MNRRKRTIAYGDRIFARVTRNGRTIFNYVTDSVSTMTELIGELRLAMRNLQGLVMLHIRNYHQGWGEDRPLMLYAPEMPRWNAAMQQVAGGSMAGDGTQMPGSERRMLSPWEVH